MSQNSERLYWTFDEVDNMLKDIMTNIFSKLNTTAQKYEQDKNYVLGANVAGFERVVEAMQSQGIV